MFKKKKQKKTKNKQKNPASIEEAEKEGSNNLHWHSFVLFTPPFSLTKKNNNNNNSKNQHKC